MPHLRYILRFSRVDWLQSSAKSLFQRARNGIPHCVVSRRAFWLNSHTQLRWKSYLHLRKIVENKTNCTTEIKHVHVDFGTHEKVWNACKPRKLHEENINTWNLSGRVGEKDWKKENFFLKKVKQVKIFFLVIQQQKIYFFLFRFSISLFAPNLETHFYISPHQTRTQNCILFHKTNNKTYVESCSLILHNCLLNFSSHLMFLRFR